MTGNWCSTNWPLRRSCLPCRYSRYISAGSAGLVSRRFRARVVSFPGPTMRVPQSTQKRSGALGSARTGSGPPLPTTPRGCASVVSLLQISKRLSSATQSRHDCSRRLVTHRKRQSRVPGVVRLLARSRRRLRFEYSAKPPLGARRDRDLHVAPFARCWFA